MVEVRKNNRKLVSQGINCFFFLSRWIIISNVRHHLYQTSRKVRFIYKLSKINIPTTNTHTKKQITHDPIMSYNARKKYIQIKILSRALRTSVKSPLFLVLFQLSLIIILLRNEVETLEQVQNSGGRSPFAVRSNCSPLPHALPHFLLLNIFTELYIKHYLEKMERSILKRSPS